MTEIKKKGGVVISKEGQHIRITVPSFSTVNIVYPEDKSHFIKYLKYIYNITLTEKLQKQYKWHIILLIYGVIVNSYKILNNKWEGDTIDPFLVSYTSSILYEEITRRK